MRNTVACVETSGSPSGEPTPKPALLTKIVAVVPLSIVAILPQGMLINGPFSTLAILPLESNTIRQPSPRVLVVPSELGALPTMTQPDFSIVMAVVKPTPPGHCGRLRGIIANCVNFLVVGL
jgi:hypothetical protein